MLIAMSNQKILFSSEASHLIQIQFYCLIQSFPELFPEFIFSHPYSFRVSETGEDGEARKMDENQL